MSKIRNFDIIFSHLGGVYNAGENIEGKVTLELAERMNIKDISVLIQGKAEVSFQSGKYTYSKSEKYFREIMYLFTTNRSNDSHLAAGAHVFNFEYFLPSALPCSFEGKYGHVRYTVEVKIDRGAWKTSVNKTRILVVKSDLNLNSYRGIQEPVRYESKALDRCCCWRTGSLNLVVHLPRKGYVPGDNILVDAEVNNETTGTGNISMELAQFTIYHTKSGSKRWKQTIYTRPRSPVNAGDTVELSREPIHIPSLPPTGLPGCKLIDIIYTLKVKVRVKSLECKIPINVTVGTIPLISAMNTPVLEPPPYRESRDMDQLWELPPSPPGYTAVITSGSFPLPPPTYEQGLMERYSVSGVDYRRKNDVTTTSHM